MTNKRPPCSCHAPNDNTPEEEHAPDCARELWSPPPPGWSPAQQTEPPYALIQECEVCHHTRPGRWLDTDDGRGEWFTCYECEPYDSEKE